MKGFSQEIRKHLGAHQIEIGHSDRVPELNGVQPIFIFDYLSMSDYLRNALMLYTCELSCIEFGSLDIIGIAGDEMIKLEKTSSFWFWDENGLIPFAYVGKGAERGPFNSHEGVLFINTTTHSDSEEMPILLLRMLEDEVELVQIADGFNKLNLTKKTPNRELAEQLKQEGNECFGTGDFEGAADKFYASISADSTYPNSYNNIGMITQVTQEFLERGEACFQLAYLVDPEFTDGMRGSSSIIANRGSWEEAIEIMEACLVIEKSALNYAILARAYADNGEIEKAKKACDQGLELDENHPELARIIEKLNEYQS